MANKSAALVLRNCARKFSFARKQTLYHLRSQNTNSFQSRQTSSLLPTIHAPEAFNNIDRWIVFSDLHVRTSTIDTCEAILDHIHNEALRREAGVIFLGDFWHVRGAVGVDLLNRVLKCFRKWSQPIIMIPGNHDQVTLGGIVHSVEPVSYAFNESKCLLISEPCVALGAAWIPYRRDQKLMKAILEQCNSRRGTDIGAIFCHADVKGAFMNDGMRSSEGISIYDFPSDLPIYSGHFHKPHSFDVSSITLRYVGSPYQTSLSEAGQVKYLYELQSVKTENNVDRVLWRELSRWPISFGKKYYRAMSISDPVLAIAMRGDKVVIPVKAGDEVQAERILHDMKSKGVEVEFRSCDIVSASVQRMDASGGVIEKFDEMDPISAFTCYLNHNTSDWLKGHTDGPNLSATSEQSSASNLLLRDEVHREGVELLHNLSSPANSEGSMQRLDNIKDLRIENVALSNFGPYSGKDAVIYPIGKRGLVLLTGKSMDGTGADSNGAGKTTLAMSVLWGLTGSLDARLASDGKSSDVTFDDGSDKVGKRAAEVTIDGTINGLPFKILRKKGARKSDLKFFLDGHDLTTQSVKDTQVVIDNTLGVGKGLVERCCFFGQHSHTMQGLLGMTDAKFKAELSVLVNSDLWENALLKVKSIEKECKNNVTAFIMEIRLRNEEVSRSNAMLEEALQHLTAAQARFAASKQSIELHVGAKESGLNSTMLELDLRTELQAILERREYVHKQHLQPLRNSLFGLSDSNKEMIAGLDNQIDHARQNLAHFQGLHQSSTIIQNTLAAKQKQIKVQIDAINSKIAPILEILGHQFHACDYNNQNELKVSLDSIKSKIAVTESQLQTTKSNFWRINLLTQKVGKNICDHLGTDEKCPSCGQTLDVQTLKEKNMELKVQVGKLEAEYDQLKKSVNTLSSVVDHSQKLQDLKQQLKRLSDQEREFSTDLNLQNSVLESVQSEIEYYSARLNKALVEKSTYESNSLANRKEAMKTISKLEVEIVTLNEREGLIRSKLEEVIKSAATEDMRLIQLQACVDQENIRLNDSLAAHKKFEDLSNNLTEAIYDLVKKKELNLRRGVVYETLGYVFGGKGIQNFLLSSVLAQIERSCNKYLLVLADGGIQLSLRLDAENEKVVKTVNVKCGASKMQARALSQLSGGQWRRVSLALDLAFADYVREKGLLRCNLLVLDEILTHLDSSGRSAVGSLLKQLVSTGHDGGTESDSKIDEATVKSFPDSLGGRYETVLVILQDLAAMEMEEAFDHVDVVSKDAKGSRVHVDGIAIK